MPKSLLEHAYDYVSTSKEPVAFKDMWNYICEQAQLSEEDAAKRVSPFYTNLMLDGRFVNLGDNQWDLRVRQTFDKVHIDMKDVYSDVETAEDDAEEAEEEKEYNQAFEEPNDDADSKQSMLEDEESESEGDY